MYNELFLVFIFEYGLMYLRELILDINVKWCKFHVFLLMGPRRLCNESFEKEF